MIGLITKPSVNVHNGGAICMGMGCNGDIRLGLNVNMNVNPISNNCFIIIPQFIMDRGFCDTSTFISKYTWTLKIAFYLHNNF